MEQASTSKYVKHQFQVFHCFFELTANHAIISFPLSFLIHLDWLSSHWNVTAHLNLTNRNHNFNCPNFSRVSSKWVSPQSYYQLEVTLKVRNYQYKNKEGFNKTFSLLFILVCLPRQHRVSALGVLLGTGDPIPGTDKLTSPHIHSPEQIFLMTASDLSPLIGNLTLLADIL